MRRLAMFLVVLALLTACQLSASPVTPQSYGGAAPGPSVTLAPYTGARVGPVGIYPMAITPGAIDPRVTQSTIATTICVSGYTMGVRSVSEAEKNAVYAEYRTTNTPGANEVDHLVSLELGGSNDIANLWPEPYSPPPGAHEKDKTENYLHAEVCAGRMTLADAQTAIRGDWYSYWLQIH